VGLRVGAIRVVVGAGPLGATGAPPPPHQCTTAEEGRLPGQRVGLLLRF